MEKQKGISVLGIVVALVAISLIVVGWNEYSKNQDKKSALAIKAIYNRWQDTSKLASISPRISLGVPIKDMQAIRAEAKALVVTECFKRPKTHMENGMDKTIESFMKFMSNTDPDFVSAKSEEASISFYSASEALQRCGFNF